jgi:hypothetical protein
MNFIHSINIQKGTISGISNGESYYMICTPQELPNLLLGFRYRHRRHEHSTNGSWWWKQVPRLQEIQSWNRFRING